MCEFNRQKVIIGSVNRSKAFINGFIFSILTILVLPAFAQSNIANSYWQQMMQPTLNYVQQQQQQRQQQLAEQAKQQQQDRAQQAQHQQMLMDSLHALEQHHIESHPLHRLLGVEPSFQPRPRVDTGTKSPWLKKNQWHNTQQNPYAGQQHSSKVDPAAKRPPTNIFAPEPIIRSRSTRRPTSTNIFQ